MAATAGSRTGRRAFALGIRGTTSKERSLRGQPVARSRSVVGFRLPYIEGSLYTHARYHCHDRRAPPPRDRHRLSGGAGGAPHGAHQSPHGAPEGPQEGPSQPPWAAHARGSASATARLPPAQRRRAVPGTHREARAPPVVRIRRDGDARRPFFAFGAILDARAPTHVRWGLSVATARTSGARVER